MNTTKHVVKEIISDVRHKSVNGTDWYERDVIADSWGSKSEQTWSFRSKEKAENLEVGDIKMK